MKEFFLFFKQFVLSPKVIGSIIPSSKRLALCVIKKNPYCQAPKRYLEVGGGSGAITHYLVSQLLLEDRLDVVERDPHFCALLRSKFGHLNNVCIHEVSILDFEGQDYDGLISSLPLNCFQADTVNQILNKYERLVKKGGRLSYFEYLGMATLKQTLLFGKPSSDFKDTIFLKRQFASKYTEKTSKIWLNFPPARVIHCKM